MFRQRLVTDRALNQSAQPKSKTWSKPLCFANSSIKYLLFPLIVGIILDEVMLQLTPSKHSYFNALDCFQGDDITQSRWVPLRIASLSHMQQLHPPSVSMRSRIYMRAHAWMQAEFVCSDYLNSACSQLPEKGLVFFFSSKKANHRVWVKVRIGVGIAGKSWPEDLGPCRGHETRGCSRRNAREWLRTRQIR